MAKAPRNLGKSGWLKRRSTSCSKKILLYSFPLTTSFLPFFSIKDLEITFRANNSESLSLARNTTPLAPRPTAEITSRLWRSKAGICWSSSSSSFMTGNLEGTVQTTIWDLMCWAEKWFLYKGLREGVSNVSFLTKKISKRVITCVRG